MAELTEEKIYEELSADIRATDDISFKLMGRVPLLSGSGILGLVLAGDSLPAEVVVLLSLFASVVTLGLFRWELRNIQNCRWLIAYADALEQRALLRAHAKDAYRGQPRAPQGLGKRGGETIVYTATIFAWLLLPAALGAAELDPWKRWIYVVALLIVGLLTAISAFAPIDGKERP